jgi:hypothetical protein
MNIDQLRKEVARALNDAQDARYKLFNLMREQADELPEPTRQAYTEWLELRANAKALTDKLMTYTNTR